MEQQRVIQQQKPKYFDQPKDFFVLLVGVISTVYLLNFTFGFVEFLPDSIPIVGNIDEAVAGYALYSSLAYFGIDLGTFFNKKKNSSEK